MTMTYNQLSASDEKMKTKIIPSTEHCYLVSLNLYIFSILRNLRCDESNGGGGGTGESRPIPATP